MTSRKDILSEDRILSTFKQALSQAESDQAEIVLEAEKLDLTRFADSDVTQNLATAENKVIVRAIKNKKIGVAITNSLELEDIVNTLRKAEEICVVQSPDKDFQTLPYSPSALPVDSYLAQTAEYSPQRRASDLKKINSIAGQNDLKSSGAYRITTDHAAVVNSLGTEQYWKGAEAELSLTLSGDQDNSGYAYGWSRDIDQILPESLAQTAADKAVKSVNPVRLDPGEYTVILEPPALGQMVLLLSFLGFGCKSYISHRSFMSGKLGKPILGPKISLTENPYHEKMQGMPFGYEGVPRQKVELIDRGIARNVVWNSYFANLAGRKSTGHAHPAYKAFTPYPKYMVMDGGQSSLEEMIASVERGIYITHFWYVNYLNPMRTMVTGTTIDGTFLIENGKLSKPIVNMRMAQSILQALENVSLLSAEQMLYEQFSVTMLLPWAKIDKFNFMHEEEA